MNFDPKLKSVTQVYGPTANIYTDVLNVPQDATSSEIREAFFCLRYDIYQKLSDQDPGRGPSQTSMTSEERKDIETKMNAITAAFQLLSDSERRKAYDSYLAGGAATSRPSLRCFASTPRGSGRKATVHARVRLPAPGWPWRRSPDA